jgi:hypothetical protein
LAQLVDDQVSAVDNRRGNLLIPSSPPTVVLELHALTRRRTGLGVSLEVGECIFSASNLRPENASDGNHRPRYHRPKSLARAVPIQAFLINGRVRRAVFVDGMSRREAARIFGIDRQTVERMLRFSVPPGYRRSKPVGRPKLDPFVEVIDQILAEDSG